MERTLVLIKPEGVKRKLVGRILQRFEDANLTIDEMKLMTASKELVTKHYPSDKEWTTLVGNKTLGTYKQYGIDPKKEVGTDDAYEIGLQVKKWLVDYISSGPIVAMVISGNHAIDNVRKIVGPTIPLNAAPGSIRGDFSIDSPDVANAEKRPVQNLIHASGNLEEAKQEIELWFPKHK
jgi:nucleoside-diphosphate kinase